MIRLRFYGPNGDVTEEKLLYKLPVSVAITTYPPSIWVEVTEVSDETPAT